MRLSEFFRLIPNDSHIVIYMYFAEDKGPAKMCEGKPISFPWSVIDSIDNLQIKWIRAAGEDDFSVWIG